MILSVVTILMLIPIGIWSVTLVGNSVTLPSVDYSYDNETHASAGSQPETLTITHAYDNVTAETIYIHDNDTDAEELLTETTNYTVVSRALGTYSITSCPLADSEDDEFWITYTVNDINDNANTAYNDSLSRTWSSMTLLAIGLIILAAGTILSYLGLRK